jgi:hypothetical protein
MPKSRMDRTKMFRDFSMSKPDSIKANYLKSFDIVMKDVASNYDVTQSEMLFMLFFYDHDFFTIEHAAKMYRRSHHKLELRLLYPLVRKGYAYKHFDKLSPGKTYEEQIFREETKYNYRVRYALTQKGRMMVAKFYRKMEGDEPINWGGTFSP